MQKKKENLLDKIVKRNYNNKLEEVLEHKDFTEQTKNLLLSMLYKIESAYPDYEKVKRNVETKDVYIENIISIIKEKCNGIEIVNPSSPEAEIMGERAFLIDERRKVVKCFPVERKILYAIYKLAKKDMIIDKGKYGILAKPLSNLINIGNSINEVEPLRDFNGYSWSTIPREIESIENNLIYQNLRILLGYQFLKDWVENREFIADYMVLFKKSLRSLYGENNAKIMEKIIFKVAILLDIKYNEQDRRELEQSSSEIEEQMSIIDDIRLFTENISEKKRRINERIRRIDTILNNQRLLQREYDERNANLPYDKKIFSMRVLSEQMIRERELEFEKIDKLNKLLKPKYFIQYKKELERKKEYLELIKIGNLDEEIGNLLLQLQIVFLRCFEIKINQARTKTDVTKLIYEFRYYYLLTFSYNKSIGELEQLQGQLERTLLILIDRAKQEGIIGEFSSRQDIELKIFKSILTIRTISLEDIYVTINKEKTSNEINMVILEDDEFEQKILLGTDETISKKELGVKFNKKVKVFY